MSECAHIDKHYPIAYRFNGCVTLGLCRTVRFGVRECDCSELLGPAGGVIIAQDGRSRAWERGGGFRERLPKAMWKYGYGNSPRDQGFGLFPANNLRRFIPTHLLLYELVAMCSVDIFAHTSFTLFNRRRLGRPP